MSTVTYYTAETPAQPPADTTPRPVKKKKLTHDFKDGRGRVPAHRHENGGGWVEDTAVVGQDVFVGKQAAVYHVARVSGAVAIRNRARICGAANISGTGEVVNDAYIAGKTTATDCQLDIRGYARLYGGKLVGSVRIEHNARVQGEPKIKHSTLSNECFVSGRAELRHTHICGNAMIGGHARIIGGTVGGTTVVADNAFVLDSMVRYDHRDFVNYLDALHNEDLRLRIIGETTIVNVNDLSALLVMTGATIVGGTIRFTPYVVDGAPTAVQCRDDVCLSKPDIRSYGDMELAVSGRAAGPSAAAITGPAFNLNNLIPKRRLSAVDV